MPVTILPPLDPSAAPVAFAVREVTAALERAGIEGDVIAGTTDCDGLPQDVAALVPEVADSYALGPVEGGCAVIGRDMRGLVFGLLRLANRIAVHGTEALAATEARSPAFRHRAFFDGPGTRLPKGAPPEAELELLLRHGCTFNPLASMTELADLEAIDARLVEGRDDLRTLAARTKEALAPKLRMHTEWLIEPELDCAPFEDLSPIYERIIKLWDAEVSEDGVAISQALDRPWELWKDMLRSALAACPECTSVRSSMGDFSELRMIWRAHGPASEALGPAGGMRRFVEAARQVVVEEFGRRLTVSAWGNPPDVYPLNDPASLRKIFHGHSRGEGITLLSNECEHDFYLGSPFNGNFGVSEVDHGIMFQGQREYQGLGDLPVYIGPRLRDRLSRCAKLGADDMAVARLWWSRNLYTEGVCWTWWNLYAWYRATWEPTGDPWEWARDCCRIRFGREGAEELADALMMTEELARRLFEMPGWSGSKRDAYAITHRCVFTDGRHYWRVTADPHGEAYRENHVRGRVPALLAEMDATDALADSVLDSAQTAFDRMGDTAPRESVLESFEHLRAVARVLTHYQRALLLWHYKDEPDLNRRAAEEARERCKRHALAALEAFSDYRARFTLYKDGGMVPLLRWYLRELGESLPLAPEEEIVLPIPWGERGGNGGTSASANGNRTNAWPEAAYAENLQLAASYGDPDAVGYAASFQMMAWSGALSVLVDVIDPDPPCGIRADRLYRSDSVSLTFDTNADGREDAIFYLLLDGDTGEPILLTHMRDMVQYSLNYEERYLSPENDPGTSLSFERREGGYSWHAVIPWSMLGGFDPEGGMPLGVSVMANNAAKTHPGFRLRLHYPDVPEWRDAPPVTFAYGRVER